MKIRWLIGVGLVSLLGCSDGGAKIIPVSGTVTLNGKPLANATVLFSPIAKPGEVNAGDGSAGKTNANGEYTLTTSHGLPGAQVGTHRVRISVLVQQSGSGDERRPRGGWPVKDQIPARYNEETKLTFEVTAPGPHKKDFELTSP
jgi:hypothetical protein